MDIITEIYRLPNYLYAIDIPPYWIILGGAGCKKAEQYDRIEIEILIKKPWRCWRKRLVAGVILV